MLPLALRSMLRNENRVRQFNGAQRWDELKTPFSRWLILQASTYKPMRLFDVKPCKIEQTCDNEMPKGTFAISPSGRFRYTEVILPAGRTLDTWQSSRVGEVCFDGDVSIPRLNQRKPLDRWDPYPWMSMTPAEIFSQRGGLRRAKGHVVIAGLGLGWLLKRVMERKQVTKITLVEISQELIDWVLPALNINTELLDVVCGDATKVVPKMAADVALTDIDPGYSGNSFPTCPKIGHVWTWGSAIMSRGRY